MDFPPPLKELGLPASEIAVYLYLLEQGLSTPPQIAKGTGIARTHCYGILRSLQEAKLIEEQRNGKRKAYLASDPEALLRSLDRKRETIARILPDLRGRYMTQKNKPKIQFYDGPEQVQEIYLQTLTAKEVYAIGSTAHLEQLYPKFFPRYVELVRERGILFRDILTHASQEYGAADAMRNAVKGMYDFRVLPKEYGDPPTDLLIWNDSIALIVTTNPIFGTVLTSAPLAAAMKMMFTVLRQGL
ncbi:hypothetical protein HYV74_01600 [Candidatus Uhrbacteria bacterium]|nr:hypothetical protein [Candidatus Uhrbacteria bacterium]